MEMKNKLTEEVYLRLNGISTDIQKKPFERVFDGFHTLKTDNLKESSVEIMECLAQISQQNVLISQQNTSIITLLETLITKKK